MVAKIGCRVLTGAVGCARALPAATTTTTTPAANLIIRGR
jgi:hypothetical protein